MDIYCSVVASLLSGKLGAEWDGLDDWSDVRTAQRAARVEDRERRWFAIILQGGVLPWMDV